MATTAQILAHELGEWYEGLGTADRVAEVLRHWITQSASEFPLTADELAQALSRLEDHSSFSAQREYVVSRWQSVPKGGNGFPSTQDAIGFISSWLQKQDHGVVFNMPILGGMSHIDEHHARHGFKFTGHYYQQRDYWILHVTTRGKAIYTVDREVIAEEGDLILISPNASCHFSRRTDTPSWHHSWVLFKDQGQLKQYMHWPKAGTGIYKVQLPTQDELSEIEGLVQKIQCNRTEQPLSTDLCFNYLQQAFIRIAQFLVDEPIAYIDPRVEKAMNYLSENLDTSVKMPAVSAHCHLSLSRLSSLFREEVGMSLQQYRNNLRMQQARNLLATSQLSVQRISDELGYKSPEQFSKAFSKYNRCSPRQFRKEIRP